MSYSGDDDAEIRKATLGGQLTTLRLQSVEFCVECFVQGHWHHAWESSFRRLLPGSTFDTGTVWAPLKQKIACKYYIRVLVFDSVCMYYIDGLVGFQLFVLVLHWTVLETVGGPLHQPG